MGTNGMPAGVGTQAEVKAEFLALPLDGLEVVQPTGGKKGPSFRVVQEATQDSSQEVSDILKSDESGTEAEKAINMMTETTRAKVNGVLSSEDGIENNTDEVGITASLINNSQETAYNKPTGGMWTLSNGKRIQLHENDDSQPWG